MLLHKPKNKNKKLMWTIRDVRHYQGRARERNQTQRGMKSLLTMDLYSWSCILTSSVQSLSRVQFFEMPWMPGFPVHHQLPELAQTLVHWVSDAIQPSHPLSSPSPPAFNLSQHQGLFQRVSSSHQVAKVLELQLQHQSFQWIFRPLLTGHFWRSIPAPHTPLCPS